MKFEAIFAGLVWISALAAGVQAMQPDIGAALPAAVAIPVTATPVPLNRDLPKLARLGPRLRFLGAVVLRSTDPAFGGISGLRWSGDGLVGVTDTGNWLTLRPLEQEGRLFGVVDARLAPILGDDGRPPVTKAAGDAEALEQDPAGGWVVSFEQDHRLVHFPVPNGRPDRTERLTGTMGWAPNSGGEALAILPGGARLVVAERTRRPDGTCEALLTIAGGTRSIGLPCIGGDFSPTDAVALDATHLLVLHRRYTPPFGVGAALTLVDLGPVLAGADAAPAADELARWRSPTVVDNMEGLALRREAGRVFLYLVSDDNMVSLQNTVLIKLELIGVTSPAAATADAPPP